MRTILLSLFCITVLNTTIAQDADSLLSSLMVLDVRKPVQLFYPEEWLQTSIVLYSGDSVDGLEANYDLVNHWLIVRQGDVRKILQSYQVLSFRWIRADGSPERFINTAGFETQEWLPGYFRAWGIEEVRLLELVRLPGNDYTQREVMSGESVHFVNPDQSRESEWFIAEGKALRTIALRKAKVMEALSPEWTETAKSLIKEHRLNLSQAEDVSLLLRHYSAWRRAQ